MDRVRCVNCGHPLDRGALICGECGRVQPPAGKGPEWVESEEYEVGGAGEESSSWAAVWAALSLGLAVLQFALFDALNMVLAASVPALGIVWTATGLSAVSRRPGQSSAQTAASVLYGISLAAFVAGAGVVLLRVL